MGSKNFIYEQVIWPHQSHEQSKEINICGDSFLDKKIIGYLPAKSHEQSTELITCGDSFMNKKYKTDT